MAEERKGIPGADAPARAIAGDVVYWKWLKYKHTLRVSLLSLRM